MSPSFRHDALSTVEPLKQFDLAGASRSRSRHSRTASLLEANPPTAPDVLKPTLRGEAGCHDLALREPRSTIGGSNLGVKSLPIRLP